MKQAWLPKSTLLRMQRGFSIIELMLVVTILAVLLTLAVPAFQDTILSSRLSKFSNELAASVMLARGEAIKRNAAITVCVSSDGTACGTGSWEQGWIVMCPTSDGMQCDALGSDLIVFRHQQSLPSGFKIIERSGTPLESLNFSPTVIGTSTARFTVCRASPAGNQEREVRINAAGSPMVITPPSLSSCS